MYRQLAFVRYAHRVPLLSGYTLSGNEYQFLCSVYFGGFDRCSLRTCGYGLLVLWMWYYKVLKLLVNDVV